MDEYEIDERDFEILEALYRKNGPLWKKRIHESIEHDITLQTIGRRVNKLRDAGLLDQCIVSAEGIKRKYIIAFDLTEDGEQAMKDKRRELLTSYALRSYVTLLDLDLEDVLKQKKVDEFSKEVLMRMLCEEYDLNDETQDLLRERFTREELSTIILVFEAKKSMANQLDEEFMDKVDELMETEELLREVIGSGIFSEELSQADEHIEERMKQAN
jgi:predicted transcriptional regulator